MTHNIKTLKNEVGELQSNSDSYTRNTNTNHTMIMHKLANHWDRIEDLEKKHDKQKSNVFKHYQDITKIKEQITDHSKKFSLQCDFRDLKKRFDIFSKIETIEMLRDVYLPKVQDFSDKIEWFMKDNQQVKEVVQSLDEGLSMKANWSDIKIFKQSIERDYF